MATNFVCYKLRNILGQEWEWDLFDENGKNNFI